MEQTFSGKFIKFIPRGPLLGNSTEYKNALASINSIMNKKVSAEDLNDKKPIVSDDEIYTSINTVKKYLDKKERVRTRAFGQERWNQCMTFLKYTMPPEEFKRYCDHVNQKRGVADNPGHEDYVSPERFGSTNHKEACSEALDMIRRGNGRPEDYATLIALRQMNDKTIPVNPQQLTVAKEQIMRNENFKYLTKEEHIANLKTLVVDNNRWDYETVANNLRVVENQSLQEPLLLQ